MLTTEIKKQTSPAANRRYAMLVARFLFSWLSSMLILVVVALMVNIDWTRPQVQSMLSETFHRHVALGKLSWSFGLDGLAIGTDRMAVTESDGKPLLLSGPSEIGVAVLPLIRGQMKINHLTFKQPKIWAIRVGDDTWNFSDLLQPNLDIRFVELNEGQLNLIDQASLKSAWSPYHFENIRLKLIAPRKDRKWPFYLSFSLPRTGYTTTVELTALGTGILDDWRSNKYKFDVNASQLNPIDLGPYAKAFPNMKGLFRINLAGEGVLKDGLHAVASASIKGLKFTAPQLGTIHSAEATTSGRFLVDPEKISWNHLAMNVGNVAIVSKGQLSEWQGHKPNYSANVSGKVTDVARLSELLPAVSAMAPPVPAATADGHQSFLQMLQPDKLSGTAEFDIRVSGAGDAPKFLTNIKTDGISAKQVFQQWPDNGLKWLYSLCSDPSARLRGEMKIGENNQVHIPNLELQIAVATLNTSGVWDREKGKGSLQFRGNGLDLQQLASKLLPLPEVARALWQSFALSPNVIKVGGKLDIAGDVVSDWRRPSLKIDARLIDASIAVSGTPFSWKNLNGDIKFNGKEFIFDNLRGVIGTGKFTLTGAIDTARRVCCADFHGDHIDVAQLGAALKIMQVNLPVLAERQLYGRVNDVRLRIDGSPKAPQVTLSAVPSELYFQPPGVTKPIKCVSGDILYEDDELTLTEVGMHTPNSRLVVSMFIDDLSTVSKLRRVKLRSNSSDLAEVNYYLGSPLMPPRMRSDYLSFIKQWHITNIHGRTYGDLTWADKDPKTGDYLLDGVMAFSSAGGRFGAKSYPLEHVAGVAAAVGTELLVQDVTGKIGHTSFILDGHVLNYRTASAAGNFDVRTEVQPDELLRLLPGLADQFTGKIQTDEPLSLRANVSGNKSGVGKVVFSARAGGQDNLRVHAPFGTITQPRGQSVTLDGSLTYKLGSSGHVDLNDSHLLIGDCSIQGRGKYSWTADRSQPKLELTVNSPNPLAAGLIFSMLDPATANSGIKGTLYGALNAKGNVNALATSGFVFFEKLTLPQFNIHNVTGKVETPGWLLPFPMRPEGLVDSIARLSIESLAVGDLVANNIKADVQIIKPSGEEAPRIALHRGTAEVAGGTVKLDGWLDLVNHRLHAKAGLASADINCVFRDLLKHPGEISGLANVQLNIDTKGMTYDEMLKNLNGEGTISVSNGKVARFGQLQAKLTQANLLHQGLFGFNLNNLLQSVVPVRTGEFKDLQSEFKISDGILSIDELRFSGDDMRLWGGGVINLPLQTVKLEVAGKVPRVSSSLISGKAGTVGQLSKHMTLQNLMQTITLNKLENLPPVPILGEIASDRPRTFEFKVVAPLDKPDVIAQSIEKSFHWLPAHPNASAHPVPMH